MGPPEHKVTDDIDFLGEFEFTLDPQRRLAVPSDWRSSMPGQDCYFVFPGRDRSLVLMSYFLFRQIRDEVRKISFADRAAYRKLAYIARLGKKCTCDKQGRVSLSQALLEHAGLEPKKKVLLIGAFASAQIWSPVIWREAEQWSTDDCLDVMQEIHERPDEVGAVLRRALRG